MHRGGDRQLRELRLLYGRRGEGSDESEARYDNSGARIKDVKKRAVAFATAFFELSELWTSLCLFKSSGVSL